MLTAIKKKLQPDWWPQRSNSVHQQNAPLISRDEILSLRSRVEQQNATVNYRHEVEHRTLGDARSVYRGYGMDYDESRPYFPGDELRMMNWRVTARTGEPHMKVFREERKPGVFILLDRRKNMRFGTRRRLKVAQAVRVAVELAFKARLQNASVAAVLLQSNEKSKLSWISESFDEAGVFNFIHTANEACPPQLRVTASKHTENEESLSHVIRLLTAILAQGTRVILISDFLDLDEGCRSSLLELSMTHHLQAIQIIDPVELSLPDCGSLLIQKEQATPVTLNSSNKSINNRYHELASALANSRQQLFKSLAIPCQTIMTDDEQLKSLSVL